MSIEDKYNSYIIDNARLTEQLAACQAREKMLREMFDNLLNGLRANFALSPEGRVYLKHVDESFGASDDNALKSALAAERERCAREAEKEVTAEAWANPPAAIRALGDE